MKEAFLEAMKLVAPAGPLSTQQWRLMVHLFGMGWAESLRHTGQIEAAKQWVMEYEDIMTLRWLPDNSWKWW